MSLCWSRMSGLLVACLMLTTVLAQQPVAFGELSQESYDSNQQYPNQMGYIEEGQTVEQSQEVAGLAEQQEQAQEQMQDQAQVEDQVQEQAPEEQVQEESAPEDQSQLFSMPEEGEGETAAALPHVQFPPGYPSGKAKPHAHHKGPLPSGLIEQALGSEHGHPKITRTYYVAPGDGGEAPDELDQASGAVADAIVSKAKEIKAEKLWVRQVLSLVEEMNGKVHKVRQNIETMRKATLSLLKKKRQIDNAKIQKKLEQQLSAANADLDGLQTALKRVKTKKEDFDKNKQTLANTISTIEKQLATLRGDESSAPDAAALLEGNTALLEESEAVKAPESEPAHVASPPADGSAASLKHARGAVRHGQRVAV